MVAAEICATSDVPGGVVNILTGVRDELLSEYAGHRDIDAIGGFVESEEERRELELGAADNLKRVKVAFASDVDHFDAETRQSPWTIEPFTDLKTIWHPSSI